MYLFVIMFKYKFNSLLIQTAVYFINNLPQCFFVNFLCGIFHFINMALTFFCRSFHCFQLLYYYSFYEISYAHVIVKYSSSFDLLIHFLPIFSCKFFLMLFSLNFIFSFLVYTWHCLSFDLLMIFNSISFPQRLLSIGTPSVRFWFTEI